MRFLMTCVLAIGLSVTSVPVQSAGATDGADSARGQLMKAPTCDCCTRWAAHMAQMGFALDVKEMAIADLQRLKAHLGLPAEHRTCHTALIGGYVVEGHVPAEDVKRLLDERPDALGLVVDGMPEGSPGMETGGAAEPYAVLLLKRDGTSEVFARH